MSQPDNPFTLVFDELWRVVESHPRVLELVKPGNRVHFGRERSDVKKHVSDADMPELILASTTIAANLHATSCTSKIVRQYTFIISTGDLRINERLYQVEWMLVECLATWKSNLTKLQWRDRGFVKRVDLVSGSEGQSDPARNRGIEGWSAAFTVEVEMHFLTSDLLKSMEG